MLDDSYVRYESISEVLPVMHKELGRWLGLRKSDGTCTFVEILDTEENVRSVRDLLVERVSAAADAAKVP